MEAEIPKDPSRRIDYSDYRIYIRRVLEEIDNTRCKLQQIPLIRLMILL